MRHLLLLVVVCVTGTFDRATCALIKTPPADKVVKHGDPEGTDLMPCKLTDASQGYTAFEWKKDTTKLCSLETAGNDCAFIADYSNMMQIDGINKYNIQSKGTVNFKHGGKYECKVTAATPETGEVKTLTVVANPVCSGKGKDISVPKEGSKQITCTLDYSGPDTPPTLTLKDAENKDAPGLNPSSSEPDPTDGKITRTLTATLSAANVGKYTCELVAGTITETCTMTVTAGIAKATPKDTSALIDKPAEILCTVDGAGYGTVEWTQGEKTKIGTGNEGGDPTYETGKEASYTIDKPKKHDLTVKAMKEGLEGKYTCKIGTTETYSSELMAIKEAPACSEKDDQVTCVVMYKGNKQPSVHWYKGDDKITGGDPTEGTKDAWSTSTLTTKVDDTDKKYTCKVLNGAGESITDCVGHDAAEGLQAKLYQSTLMSAFVLWLWYIMV